MSGSRPAKYLIPAAVALAGLYFLYVIREVLLPFVLGAAFAFILNPIVSFFETRGLRRRVLVIALFGAMLGLATGVGYFAVAALTRELAQARTDMPVYVQHGEALLRDLKDIRSGKREPRSPLLKRLKPLQRLPGSGEALDYVGDHWKEWAASVLQQVPSLALYAIPALELAFLVPFIAFFFMGEGTGYVSGLLDLVPARYVEIILNLIIDIDASLGSYLRGILLEAAAVGTLTYLGFLAIGLDHALQLAAAVGLANFIPYVGPIVGTVIGSGIAIVQWGTFGGVALVVVVCGAVKFVDDWLLQPLILQRTVELHPLLVLFSLLAGGHLGGLWGLLFAVPAACMVKVTLAVGWEWYRSEFGIRPSELPASALRVPLV